jgi:hypothetical protein
VVTSAATSSPTDAPGAVTAAPSRSTPPSASSTACQKGDDHTWSYVGVAFNPRRNYFEKQTVGWNVYRCGRCKRLGRAKVLSDATANKFEGRKVVELPEFRPDARERFGWSLRDSFEKDEGNEKL